MPNFHSGLRDLGLYEKHCLLLAELLARKPESSRAFLAISCTGKRKAMLLLEHRNSINILSTDSDSWDGLPDYDHSEDSNGQQRGQDLYVICTAVLGRREAKQHT